MRRKIKRKIIEHIEKNIKIELFNNPKLILMFISDNGRKKHLGGVKRYLYDYMVDRVGPYYPGLNHLVNEYIETKKKLLIKKRNEIKNSKIKL